jgi:hypothetical protein
MNVDEGRGDAFLNKEIVYCVRLAVKSKLAGWRVSNRIGSDGHHICGFSSTKRFLQNRINVLKIYSDPHCSSLS